VLICVNISAKYFALDCEISNRRLVSQRQVSTDMIIIPNPLTNNFFKKVNPPVPAYSDDLVHLFRSEAGHFLAEIETVIEGGGMKQVCKIIRPDL